MALDDTEPNCRASSDALISSSCAAGDVAGRVADAMTASGIWRGQDDPSVHRVSPLPFALTPSEIQSLRDLGEAIYSFYCALNHLCLRKGHEWAVDYLDRGKPSWLLDAARMNFSKQHLPRLLRPDLILADDGMWVTELDSVPGGAGQTAAMAAAYDQCGLSVIGGGEGVTESFARAVSDLAGRPDWTLAIVVSDESEDYRAEMAHLAERLRRVGHRAWCVHPRDVFFDEEGLWLDGDGARARIDVVWRFFELFDLRNIPKSELVMYASKKRKVIVSPPYKPFLEEKMALALLHHEALSDFWEQEMGRWYGVLRDRVPATWIMDPSPVPAHAEISGLRFGGRSVRDFRVLAEATQKQRRLVIKPSGFHPDSWGARGVVVGHDVSHEVWKDAVEHALGAFGDTPHVLQEFHEGRRLEIEYLDPATGRRGRMTGRTRLSPYYYVSQDRAELAGVLATICSDDKKLIHGMKDAVMTVCSERGSDSVQDGR